MKVLDLFSGIGGFSLGLERAGMKTVAFCEIGKQQRQVIGNHFPGVKIFDDVRKTDEIVPGLGIRPDVIAGGDPCPIRSKARSNGKCAHPDLSGYFLALVGRCRPRWVLRENVVASDDVDFATCLGVLGYRTIIIRANSFPLTAQNRTRDFIVGCNQKELFRNFISVLPQQQSSVWHDVENRTQISGYPCLTTQRSRYDSRDGYIWQAGKIRIADKEERCRLAGFPDGWLDGFSETACARMFGNSVTPGVVEIIGKAIMEQIREGR